MSAQTEGSVQTNSSLLACAAVEIRGTVRVKKLEGGRVVNRLAADLRKPHRASTLHDHTILWTYTATNSYMSGVAAVLIIVTGTPYVVQHNMSELS